MSIGYIGVGNMGGALASRLCLSHQLLVYDKSVSATNILQAKGADVANNLAQVGHSCDIIFICLPTSTHVHEVLFGHDRLVDFLKPGTVLVDQTTGDPFATRSMASELLKTGVFLVDAPVSGGKMGAEAGTIAIMVGAEQGQYDQILPILKTISSNIFWAGGVGNGHVIKLVNNLMSTSQRALSFEAVTLAAKNGLDPKVATDILLASGGRNAYLEKMMRPRILEGKLNVGFTLALAHKDVRLACQLGQASNVPMFFGNTTKELYQLAISQIGQDEQVDKIGMIFDKISGTEVIPQQID